MSPDPVVRLLRKLWWATVGPMWLLVGAQLAGIVALVWVVLRA